MDHGDGWLVGSDDMLDHLTDDHADSDEQEEDEFLAFLAGEWAVDADLFGFFGF